MADGSSGYSLSDLYGGAPSTTVATAATEPGTSGYSLSDLYGGATAPTTGPGPSPAAAPPAPAPASSKGGGKSKGGGGLLGSIWHTVTGVPKGIAELGKEVGTAALRGTENLANDVGYLASRPTAAIGVGGVGGANEPHLGGLSGTPDYSSATGKVGFGSNTIVAPPSAVAARLRTTYPLLEAQRAGLVTTGEHAAGAAQGLASLATGAQLHPLGENLERNLIHGYATNPLGAGLNDALNVAIGLGPIADLAEAARIPGAGLAKTVTEGAGKVAAAPFAPYRALALGADLGRFQIPGVLEGLNRVVDATGAAGAAKLAEGEPGPLSRAVAGTRTGEAVGATMARVQARGVLRQAGIGREAAVGEVARNVGLAREALGRDPEMEHALQLRQVGAAPAVTAALRADRLAVLAGERITPRTARLVAGLGSPAEEAALQAAEQIRVPFIAGRQAEELAGTGRLGGPMNPEQAGNAPLSAPVEAAAAVPEAAATAAETALAAQRAQAGLGGGLNALRMLPPMTDIEAQAMAGRLGIPVEAIKAAEAARAQPTNVAAAAEQARTLRQAANEARAAAEADIANAPARYRPALQLGVRIAAGLREAANEADKAAPGGGDLYREGAASIPVTLRALVDAGIDPQHLIGGREEQVTPAGRQAGERLPQLRKLSSEQQKTVGTIPSNLTVTAQREASRATRVIANVTALPFQDRFGTTVAKLGIQPEDLGGSGWTAWDPRAWTQQVPADQVGPETPVIPTKLYQTFKDYWEPNTREPGGLVARYDQLVRAGKSATLALNPAYHAAVILGNFIRNSVVGGADPLTLGRNMIEAARLLREQARTTEQIIPAELTGGLTANEGETLGRPGRGLPGRLGAPARAGYRLAGFTEQVQRLGLYLTKQEQGFTPEQAVREALKVTGDFRHLAPYEQQVVRRILPGYVFYKHITTLALRLPLENPLRAAWLAHLGQQTDAAKLPGGPYWLNPLGQFGTVPRLALPIQAAAEVGLGLNPSRYREVTRPAVLNAAGKPSVGPIITRPNGLRESWHLLSNLTPQGRLVGALTQANIHRYDTGEPSKTAAPFPGGRLGAVEYALGLTGPTNTATAATSAGRGGRRGGRALSRGGRR